MVTIPGSSNVNTPTTPSRANLTACGLLAVALTLLGALLAPPRSPAAIGDLSYVDCIANLGRNGCEEPAGDPLGQPSAVTVSRDGKSVYVTSSHAVVWFKRDLNGTLNYAGCIGQGTAHGCEQARHKSLDGLTDIAISRDDKSVYVVAFESKSITRFKRSASGALTYKGCFANRGAHGCKRLPHNSLGDAAGVAVSGDGNSVYAVASGYRALPSRDVRGGNSITRFKRRSNGAISYGGCIADHGSHGCRAPAHNSLYGSLGVAVSPDGNSVYIASSTGISRLRRSPNGALTYRGCFANQGHHGCKPTIRGSVRGSRDVAVSPDGTSLYDASSSGITEFARSSSGALTYDGCIENHGTHGCEAPAHDSLRFPQDLALSRDGRSVYVASSIADSITDLKRADDGTLTYGGCFADGGVRGCQVPAHDSLGRARGVAVSRDGRSVYVAAPLPANAITFLSRENFAP